MPLTATQRVAHFLKQYGLLYLGDCLAWAVGILAALVLRFDFDLSRIHWGSTPLLILFTWVLQLIGGWVFWLYRSRYEIGGFDEVRAVVLEITAVTVIAWLFAYLIGYSNGIPRSTMIIAAPIAFSVMGVLRYLKRLGAEQRAKPGRSAERVLLYGSGYLGAQTAKRLLTDAESALLPVGFLDDDVEKRNHEVRGVRVHGGFGDLARVVEETGATAIMVCIGDADASLLRRIDEAADRIGIRVMVLPSLEQLLQNASAISDVRDISIEDLIGRHPVRLEMASIAEYLQDRVVLVTGAGGSIGSELSRQLARFAPRELILLDRDETALQTAQLSISGHGLLDTRDVVLADIRDADALQQIFAERKPEVVFHAAALKHLPMLEQYPEEAWKTNVQGTLNVLRAAQAVGVDTFVNISTDKAANPTSVLGHSKRVAEKLTAWMAQETGERYLSVRFGNVIGSRGSMLPTFAALIESGGPVTVTHPDVTRFFMTIPEACQLVVQAGGIGRPGEVLILDMGEPVRILDVAQRMIAQSGKPIEIVFTGLRHGEKLHEELVALGEGDERPFHPKISHAHVDVLAPDRLDHDGWVARLDLTDEAEERVPVSLGLTASLVAGTTLLLSLLLPFAVRPLLVRLGIMDVPNERSSHSRPVLRGLGLAVLIAMLVGGLLGVVLLQGGRSFGDRWDLLLVIVLASLAAGILGLGEDLHGVSVRARSIWLILIALAGPGALLLLASRPPLPARSFGWVNGSAAVPLQLEWWSAILLLLYAMLFVSGYINVANFVDGLNGISGLHGVIAGLAFAAAGWMTGLGWLVLAGLVLAAGFAGFLPWNLTKPGAFLGDVGSYLLGGAVAITSFAALLAGVPLLATIGPMVITFGDVGVTLVKRVREGKRWDEPHKEHTYQRIEQRGYSHLQASLLAAGCTLLTSLLGLGSLFVGLGGALLLFVGGLLVLLVYLALPRLLPARA